MLAPNKITEALMAAMMHSSEPMVLTDATVPDYPMIAINDAFENLTLYPRAETLGRNCRFLQGAGTDVKTPPRIRGHLEAGRGAVEWIVNYKRDGSMFWNLLFLSPIFSQDGVLLHYFGNQRDITLGPPPDLPNYSIGAANMNVESEAKFHNLLLGLLDEERGYEASARGLERLVEAARDLDQATVGLAPAPWKMP